MDTGRMRTSFIVCVCVHVCVFACVCVCVHVCVCVCVHLKYIYNYANGNQQHASKSCNVVIYKY